MSAEYTYGDAEYLLKLPTRIPGEYMAAKRRRSPAEAEEQRRLNFPDLMELRVWNMIHKADRSPWSVIIQMSERQAERLTTPYPLADTRTLEEMALPPEEENLRGRNRGYLPDENDELTFQKALAHLRRCIEHDGNTPVLWRAGRDLNIAPPGADIIVAPNLNGGRPTIEGTHITVAEFNRLADSTHGAGYTARWLKLTEPQAQAAEAFGLVLTSPARDWYYQNPLYHATLPGDPATALERLKRRSPW